MAKRSYTFYCDPGHGWLKVSFKELKALGIQDKITRDSYMRWNGESWDYPALKDITDCENVLVYGLANDQGGYVLADNEYHSLIGENEEVNAISKKSGSTFAKAFIDLVSSVN